MSTKSAGFGHPQNAGTGRPVTSVPDSRDFVVGQQVKTCAGVPNLKLRSHLRPMDCNVEFVCKLYADSVPVVVLALINGRLHGY